MPQSPAVSKMSKSGKRFSDPDDLSTLLFPFQGGQSVHLSDITKLNKESLLNPREELLFCLRKIYRFFCFFFFYVLVSVASIHNDDWRAAETISSLCRFHLHQSLDFRIYYRGVDSPVTFYHDFYKTSVYR